MSSNLGVKVRIPAYNIRKNLLNEDMNGVPDGFARIPNARVEIFTSSQLCTRVAEYTWPGYINDMFEVEVKFNESELSYTHEVPLHEALCLFVVLYVQEEVVHDAYIVKEAQKRFSKEAEARADGKEAESSADGLPHWRTIGSVVVPIYNSVLGSGDSKKHFPTAETQRNFMICNEETPFVAFVSFTEVPRGFMPSGSKTVQKLVDMYHSELRARQKIMNDLTDMMLNDVSISKYNPALIPLWNDVMDGKPMQLVIANMQTYYDPRVILSRCYAFVRAAGATSAHEMIQMVDALYIHPSDTDHPLFLENRIDKSKRSSEKVKWHNIAQLWMCMVASRTNARDYVLDMKLVKDAVDPGKCHLLAADTSENIAHNRGGDCETSAYDVMVFYRTVIAWLVTDHPLLATDALFRAFCVMCFRNTPTMVSGAAKSSSAERDDDDDDDGGGGHEEEGRRGKKGKRTGAGRPMLAPHTIQDLTPDELHELVHFAAGARDDIVDSPKELIQKNRDTPIGHVATMYMQGRTMTLGRKRNEVLGYSAYASGEVAGHAFTLACVETGFAVVANGTDDTSVSFEVQSPKKVCGVLSGSDARQINGKNSRGGIFTGDDMQSKTYLTNIPLSLYYNDVEDAHNKTIVTVASLRQASGKYYAQTGLSAPRGSACKTIYEHLFSIPEKELTKLHALIRTNPQGRVAGIIETTAFTCPNPSPFDPLNRGCFRMTAYHGEIHTTLAKIVQEFKGGPRASEHHHVRANYEFEELELTVTQAACLDALFGYVHCLPRFVRTMLPCAVTDDVVRAVENGDESILTGEERISQFHPNATIDDKLDCLYAKGVFALGVGLGVSLDCTGQANPCILAELKDGKLRAGQSLRTSVYSGSGSRPQSVLWTFPMGNNAERFDPIVRYMKQMDPYIARSASMNKEAQKLDPDMQFPRGLIPQSELDVISEFEQHFVAFQGMRLAPKLKTGSNVGQPIFHDVDATSLACTIVRREVWIVLAREKAGLTTGGGNLYFPEKHTKDGDNGEEIRLNRPFKLVFDAFLTEAIGELVELFLLPIESNHTYQVLITYRPKANLGELDMSKFHEVVQHAADGKYHSVVDTAVCRSLTRNTTTPFRKTPTKKTEATEVPGEIETGASAAAAAKTKTPIRAMSRSERRKLATTMLS